MRPRKRNRQSHEGDPEHLTNPMRTKLLLFHALMGLAMHSAAQPLLPATTRGDLHTLANIAAKEPNARKLVDATKGRFPTAYMQGRCMVGLLARLNKDASLPADPRITWGTRIGDIVSFRIDAHELELLGTLVCLDYAELALCMRPALDKVVRATRADSVQRGISLPQSYTGRDVIIGITDWGLEYRNPMFYDTALTATRILAAWDQSKQSGPPPTGYGYGTAYLTASELLAQESDTVGSWGIRDYHGTHVAGIAGGGGAGTAYRGIAFDAQFLFVSTELDQSAMLDGFAWMRDMAQAEGKRLVINMSFGRHDGNLDGSSLWNQAIDQISAQGVVFVAAAGNDGGVASHIGHAFNGDTVRTRARTFSQMYGPPDANVYGQQLLLWGEAGRAFSASFAITTSSNAVLVSTPWYSTSAPPVPMDSALVLGNDTIRFTFACESAHPLNGRPMLRFAVREPPTGRRVALMITAADGTVHAWNDALFTPGVAGGAMDLQVVATGWAAGNDDFGVSDPACAQSVIAVGAFASEYQTSGGSWVGGARASFSSKGPTLDGRLKPEISAPGESVASSVNSLTSLSYSPVATVGFDGLTYAFARASGTSMAAPAVTGIAAMLLEAAPMATAQEIKDVIMATARTDNNTGIIPPQGSNSWGTGKVNAYRAVLELLGVVGVPQSELSDLLIWPNPATDVLYALMPQVGKNMRYALLDIAGRALEEGQSDGALLTIDMLARPSGVYSLCIVHGDARMVRRFVRR
jgi:minor extracellular serine protease Vpr